MALEKIEVTLPAELIEFARSLVDGEDFVCLDDVLIEALCRFRPFIETERRDREWLKAEVQKGIDAADRGDKVDGPTFMEDLLARSRKRAGQVS
jgi:hypothetical protein